MGSPLNQFIEVRSARLRVRIAGAGPTVLLVHGWAIDLDMWTPQFAALAGRYHLIAFDRRGFGYSSGTPGIDQDLADIEQLLDTLDIDSVAIVGVDMRDAVRVTEDLGVLRVSARDREEDGECGEAT